MVLKQQAVLFLEPFSLVASVKGYQHLAAVLNSNGCEQMYDNRMVSPVPSIE